MYPQQKTKPTMALLLNRPFCFSVTLLFAWAISFSQKVAENTVRNTKDYKDTEQHEKFNKRCQLVGAWQINKLKEGALVVRLKTNSLLIEALRSSGKDKLAREKELETFAINKNTMFAYMDKLTFCKVYFIYSNFSDSLLHGARDGIFLDTNLCVDPAIHMNEDFYLLAERDYGYNSSIGFVPEDSAAKCVESGNGVKIMAVVLKNKYGHQLKSPMAWRIPERSSNATFLHPITATEKPDGHLAIYFYVNKNYLKNYYDKNNKGSDYLMGVKGNANVELKKQETYEKIAAAIEQLNDNLKEYLQRTPPPEESKMPPDVRPFLY